jgi:dCMP deaminase
MFLAGVKEVCYAYSNEDGEPHDLSAERGYLEIARPIELREMPVRSLPVRDEGEDLYDAWSRATR